MPFAKLYPLLVAKAERKGRTREEVDQVTTWLTGYTAGDIARLEQSTVSYGDFFLNAPVLKPNRTIQHPVNGGGAPFCFARHCFDSAFLQIPLNLANTIALYIEFKNLSHDLRFFWDNLQNAILTFGIAEKLGVIQNRFTAAHPLTNAKLDQQNIFLKIQEHNAMIISVKVPYKHPPSQ